MSSYSVSMHHQLLNHSVVENYETETKMCVDTKIWMPENNSSLSFNSIHFIFNSYASFRYHILQWIRTGFADILCTVHLLKTMPHNDVPIY